MFRNLVIVRLASAASKRHPGVTESSRPCMRFFELTREGARPNAPWMSYWWLSIEWR